MGVIYTFQLLWIVLLWTFVYKAVSNFYFWKIFSWSILDFQCCANLHCTAKWLSFTHIDILFQIIFCYGLSLNVEYISFCYTLGPCSDKAMAPHSSPLVWKIPWTEEPGRLRSMGSRRVGYNWASSLSLFTFMHWRRKWQPTPVFLPGESQGRGNLVGCRLWGRTESDTTEAT